MTRDPSTERPGLQAERTLLSWDRTLLGVLGNGALLLLRDVDLRYLDRIAVLAAALLALAACGLARRHRGRALLHVPRPRTRPAGTEVILLGGAVALLGGAVLAFTVAEWASG